MQKFQRRDFLKKAAVATAAGGTGFLVGCNTGGSSEASEAAPSSNTEAGGAPAVQSQTFEWKMVTTWPPTLPIFSDGVKMMAQQIEEMSEGRLKIQVFGGGELVPPLESFDAVNQGTAEMGHGASYYWAGKAPATQFFTSVPFGMNAQQMYGWLYAGGGLELWEEVYADFNLVPIPAGNSGVQMGGWFNKEINTIDDYQGLKMRIPGLGGKVVSEAGGSAELIPGGEIYTSLERGVVDATEWVGPYHDSVMGFHKVAQYYYYPGWHEPGSVLELLVNRDAYNALPKDLQGIVRRAAEAQNTWMLAQFEGNNNQALQTLINNEGVELRRFPDEVMQALKVRAEDVIADVAASDPMSKKVFESFRKFQLSAAAYANISERAYYNLIQVDV